MYINKFEPKNIKANNNSSYVVNKTRPFAYAAIMESNPLLILVNNSKQPLHAIFLKNKIF